MITNMHRNIMGTISFDAKFPTMRKTQEFIVYNRQAGDTGPIQIQSDTRIGRINLDTGKVTMSKPHALGAYNHHLGEAQEIATLDAETLLMLKAKITGTASEKAGTNGIVFCDNSGAANVMGDPS